MFFKYTNKIEEERNKLKFLFNWPKEKILSIERQFINKSSERTTVILDMEDDDSGYKLEQYYEISRKQHNELIDLLSNLNKNKT